MWSWPARSARTPGRQRGLEYGGAGRPAEQLPAQCSGGEQQRGAIARALAKNPDVLLCDEPTGALDYQTGKAILALLYDLCRQSRKTVIVVTHNGALAPTADILIRMKTVRSSPSRRIPTRCRCRNWSGSMIWKTLCGICGAPPPA